MADDLKKEGNRVLDLFEVCSNELVDLENERLGVNEKIVAKRNELETIQFQLDAIRRERQAKRKRKWYVSEQRRQSYDAMTSKNSQSVADVDDVGITC